MRAISDYLAKEFAARGIQVENHQLVEGRQYLKFASGASIYVSAFASDAEISAAAYKAHNMTDDNIETTDITPPTADKMPAVDLARPAEKPRGEEPKMGGVMSKGYRPGSLKALLDGLHKEGQSLMEEVAKEAAQVQKAYGRLRNVKSDLQAHREGIMSELGQFSNLADED